MMLSTNYQELLSIRFQRFMSLLGLLLGIFSYVYSDFVNQRWSYIEEIPSEKWSDSQEGKYTFLCAFGMLYTNAPVQIIGEESNVCTKYLGDEFRPEYTHYIKKIYFQDIILASNTRSVSVRHYLSDQVKIGDKFRFVILKLTDQKFDIAFQTMSGTKILFVKARRTAFAFTDSHEDGSLGPDNETSTYPFYELKEYIIVLEVLAERWQIYVDNILFATFDHRQPFINIKRIEVTSYDNVTLINYLNITGA